MVDPLSAKTMALAWAAALQTGVEVYTSDLATLIFGLSLKGVRMGEWGDSLDADYASFDMKKYYPN